MAIPSAYRLDWLEQTTQGLAVPGAQIYICTQPASTGSVPPSPLATVYTDSTAAHTLTQPLVTNGYGECYGYLAGGIYTVVVVYNGSITAVYPDQAIGALSLGFVTSNEGSLPAGGLVFGNGGTDIIAGALFPDDPTQFLNGNGVFSTPDTPSTFTPVSGQFLTGFSASTGLFSASTIAYSQITGPPQLPVTNGGTTSQWLNSYNSTTGVFTSTQPSFADISGTTTAAQLVVMVGDSGSGGVKGAVPAPGAGTAASGSFLKADGTWAVPSGSGTGLTSVGLAAPSVFSVSGSPLTSNGAITLGFATGQTANSFLATPNGSSGALSLRTIAVGDVPSLPASQITSGTLALAQGGFGLSMAGQGGTVNTSGTQVLHMNASSVISSSAITAQDLPSSLPASIIGSGQLALARGGTFADLSATGGANQVLVQTTSGGSIGVQTLTASFIPSRTIALVYVLGGPGATLSTGAQFALQLPFGVTVTSWTLTANASGSCVIDLLNSSFSGYPGSLTSITASAKPTLSSAASATSSTLTGWTTSLAATSILQASITSVSTITQVTLTLTCTALYA